MSETPPLSFEEEDELYNQMLRDLYDACGRHDFPTAEAALFQLERRFPEEAVTARLVMVTVFSSPS